MTLSISAASGISLLPHYVIRHSERSVPMAAPTEIVPLRFPSGREVEESLFDFTARIRIVTERIRFEKILRNESGR
jgi:hypothetical protein